MSPQHYEDCEKCEEHLAWEERLKVLDNIPKLLTWMNITKGVMIVLGLLVSLVIGIVVTTRHEIEARQEKHEKYIDVRQERLTDQVLSISKDATDIKTSVAVLVKSVELKDNELQKELDTLRKTIK